ncbi:MAG: S8 family serine peptidase [Oligoflexia bacterium]|nr:S8 family serine peptidase [Oligoflexia bacterium]
MMFVLPLLPLLPLLLLPHASAASTASTLQRPAPASTQVLVKLVDFKQADRLAQDFGLDIGTTIPQLNIVALHVPPSDSMQSIIGDLTADPRVLYAEPEQQVEALAVPDPMEGQQWNFRQIGAHIAWRCGATGAGIVVAVVDTGLATYGEDTPSWLPGVDFVDNDDDPDDLNGHGTHVAGTIAQTTGNGIGVAGVAYDARILPVRVLDAAGSGTTTNVAAGMVWAVDEGADIINLSLGGSSSSSAIEDAVAYARHADVVVVAAAGNSGTSGVSYPAATEGVIAVAATTRSGDHAWYSSTGPEIAFAAPGGDTTGTGEGIIQETTSGDDDGSTIFEELVGTSMATPHVSAAYAILLSLGASVDEATESLKITADDLGTTGDDDTYGAGEIRIGAATRVYLTEHVTHDPAETYLICHP